MLELINLNRMFASGRGYKDLIRDFKQQFNVELPKPLAKQFLLERSWAAVLKWLTGDDIDTKDLDKIPERKPEEYKLLDVMLRYNEQDEQERRKDLEHFNEGNYYIPENVKYFNMPLYGEIITYKYKDPYMKCFLLDSSSHKVTKIENVYISDKLPDFLLQIIRKINASYVATKLPYEMMIQQPNYNNLITYDEAKNNNRTNIFDSDLFHKYNIVAKC